ncbi:MAG TPA: hypothetical protein V6C97_03870 [Oculatellaceae cyanobacterium]
MRSYIYCRRSQTIGAAIFLAALQAVAAQSALPQSAPPSHERASIKAAVQAKSQAQTSSSSQPAVVLEFPQKVSLGTLFSMNKGQDVARVGAARGPVSVPADMRLALTASYALLNDKGAMDLLPKNCLTKINLDRVEADDEKPFDISFLKKQERLEFIVDMQTDITEESVTALGELKNLKYIELWYVGFKGTKLSAIAKLPKLEELVLAYNPLSQPAWQAIGTMQQLRKLSISSCGATDQAMVEVGRLTKLKQLRMGKNLKVTSRGFANLKNLKQLNHLDLENTMFCLQDVQYIRNIPLKEIHISSRRFTKSDLQQLKKQLPKVSVVESDKVDNETQYIFSPLK